MSLNAGKKLAPSEVAMYRELSQHALTKVTVTRVKNWNIYFPST